MVSPSTEPPDTPYGPQLASLVADRLERGDVLSYRHRDYCGLGLRFAEGDYIYGEVSDGLLPSTPDLRSWSAIPPKMERLVFASRKEFVEWLARQSDDALSGRELQPEWLIGNQRISRHRLASFAQGDKVPWSE
jgi:hypothetical protein